MTSFNGFNYRHHFGIMKKQLNRLVPALLAIAGDRDTTPLEDVMPVNPNGTTRLCRHCNAPFRVTKHQVDKGRHYFCRRQCWIDSGRTPEAIASRFWAKIDKQSAGSCWLWTGSRIYSGYGKINVAGRLVFVHRLSYEIAHGPIPDGLTIDHVWAKGCRHRNCVNPEHLEAVTQRENAARGNSLQAINARKTHCKNGHPLSGENLIVINPESSRPRRWCRVCSRTKARRNAKKARDAQRSIPNLFGELARSARLQAGLAQREVGERLGFSLAYVNQVEMGSIKSPPVERARLWALIVGGDPDEFERIAIQVIQGRRDASVAA